MKYLTKGKKGQIGGQGMAIIGLFLVLTIVGVLQTISVLTVSKVQGNIDQSDFTAEQNTTTTNLQTTTLDSFELGSTAQIVLAAVVILASVFGLITVMRGR